jgi:hypothetical protein
MSLITKALIIDEPWISKILNGEKDWEMRSTRTSFRGKFGLIRKGSGQVVGVAELNEVSGPYTSEQLTRHQVHHHVPPEITNQEHYKWNYAWHLEHVTALEYPVHYQHKNGAVIWVELNEDAQLSLMAQLPEAEATTSEVQYSEEISHSISVDDCGDMKLDHGLAFSSGILPKAKDGTVFTKDSCNSKGLYTVGEKGEEQKFDSFIDALEYLKTMPTAKWRRPNKNGNWGIVSAVEWV